MQLVGRRPLKSEHVTEMLTCSLQATCNMGDTTNDCKRLPLGEALSFLWGSLGSTLCSCCVGGLIQIQYTPAECPPPVSGSLCASQKPSRKVVALAHCHQLCWCTCFPALALEMLDKVRQQFSLLMRLKPRQLLRHTSHVHFGLPVPLVIPLPMPLPVTWSPCPWLSPDTQEHPRCYKQAFEGVPPPYCPGDVLVVACKLVLHHALQCRKPPHHSHSRLEFIFSQQKLITRG